MTLFFGNEQTKERSERLFKRIVSLNIALENEQITPAALAHVVSLTNADLAEKSVAFFANTLDLEDKTNEALHLLFQSMQAPLVGAVQPSDTFISTLESFDKEHGEYLALAPLASDDPNTLFLNLNEMARLSQLLLPASDVQEHRGELGKFYSLDIDPVEAKLAFLDWKNTRPTRIAYDPSQAEYPGLLEKFLAGTLKRDEWLTDVDMQRAFKQYHLDVLGAHVVRFNVEDIGLALHFERQKHEQDASKKPYVIPLIVNLGEDEHSRIDSRGIHWTRMVIHVNPEMPPVVTVQYTDELPLSDAQQQKIRKTLEAALSYRHTQGNFANQKLYSAFPDCASPKITIDTTGAQRDGYSCGYRALRGLMSDLSMQGTAPAHHELVHAKTSEAMRNAVCRELIGNQPIPSLLLAPSGLLNSSDKAAVVIDPDVIEGQLLAFADIASRRAKKPLDDSEVKRLKGLVEKNKAMVRLQALPVIQSYLTSPEENLHVNIQAFLKDESMIHSDAVMTLQVLFRVIASNSAIKTITIEGLQSLDPGVLQGLYGALDQLPASILLNSPEHPELSAHLNVLGARNELLRQWFPKESLKRDRDPWLQLCEAICFHIPKPAENALVWSPFLSNSDALKLLGSEGLERLLEYMANHESRFTAAQFFYRHLDLSLEDGDFKSTMAFLDVLETHLSSEFPFIPFTAMTFSMPDCSSEEQKQLLDKLQSILPLLANSQIEQINMTTPAVHDLVEDLIKPLNAFVDENKIKTLLCFQGDPAAERVSEVALLENSILKNRRSLSMRSEQRAPLTKPQEKVVLGKVGQAIFSENIGDLGTEVQIQQQQQQQVQQQMQTALDNDDLPDESVLEDESFSKVASDEALFDRQGFIDNTEFFTIVMNRYQMMPATAWDLVTGKDSVFFKYGIKKMTHAAAKMVLAYLDDFQYGLHPDNLPTGFRLQEDENKNVVLSYNPAEASVNLKASPLTVQLSQPQRANQWGGDILQFMSPDQAKSLHVALFKGIENPPALEECIAQFFFLRDVENTSITFDQRQMIFKALVAGLSDDTQADKTMMQLKSLFGTTLSAQNINALTEILYEDGIDSLNGFLSSMAQIKREKGESFFKAFKHSFIDPSNHLGELNTEGARASIQKILAFSSAQNAWWTVLTEQHTAGLELFDQGFELVDAGARAPRWSNLSQLTDGFVYFCSQLEVLRPGMRLTEFCPLSNVADMRVGLDRLISTILPNAHDLHEQFYESLTDLPLDPLGPFYASRYEGFKLVRADMQLVLGAISGEPLKDKKYSEPGSCFRVDRPNFFNKLDDFKEAQRADHATMWILRAIAPLNHRANADFYLQAMTRINEMLASTGSEGMPLDTVAVGLVTLFGTGKRGKQLTLEEVDAFAQWIAATHNHLKSMDEAYDSLMYQFLSTWRSMRSAPIRPTIPEIMRITQCAIERNAADIRVAIDAINETSLIVAMLNRAAGDYIDALVLLTQNQRAIPIAWVQKMLCEIVGVQASNRKLKDLPLDPELDQLKASIARLLAVCSSEGITDANDAVKQGSALYNAVIACDEKHCRESTSDLLQLLGHIDVGSSTLPSLQQLIQMVDAVNEKPNMAYYDLEQFVKSKLPEGCSIQLNQVNVAPVESSGNLQAIISQYMGEVIEQLKPFAGLMGQERYQSLSTSAGPAVLLRMLDDLGKMPSGMMATVAQSKVTSVLQKIYASVMANALTRIGTNNGSLNTVIEKRIAHPILTMSHFGEFVKQFGPQLSAMEQFIGHLQAIRQQWPDSFQTILNTFTECSLIQAYPLAWLAEMTETFVKEFDPTQPFPEMVFKQLFAFTAPIDEKLATSRAVTGILFDPDESAQLMITHAEKALLCGLGFRACELQHDHAVVFIQDLLALKKATPATFTTLLGLLSGSKDPLKDLRPLHDAIQKVNALSQPDCMKRVFDYFQQDKAEYFLPVMHEILSESRPRSLAILNITLLVASPEMTKEDLLALVGQLKALPPNELSALAMIYESPRHPDLGELNKFLAKVPRDMALLEVRFDRDPFGVRHDPVKLNAQFDTQRLPQYLDQLRDLNDDHTLLLSQRQTLQRWFLYINTIGKDRPILTHPTDPNQPGEWKAIKEMSHRDIQGLLTHYRTQLRDKTLSPALHIKAKLETIALLREAMYRATGHFPRATQILYLLTQMQQGANFISQIQTGQGKSLTAALGAAMAHLEGNTVDVCTSNLFLASEGLEENKGFFDYLGIHTQLINANSSSEDYQAGAIHYSSMAELALYRSKTQLAGKVFPKDTTLIADEVDFSTLDDNTRYRYATSLDPVTDPYQSPYTWIYEALVDFVDKQTEPLSDADLIKQATGRLKHAANSLVEQDQLKKLQENPTQFHKRLTTWLIAAGKTKHLVTQEQTKFRVITLAHPKLGSISKACLLTGGRPNIQAEFSNTIQQFLHVRLREKYRAEIGKDTDKMPNFLVEPEKTYVTSLNSKILMNTYSQRWGMSGTVGSTKEIKEQFAKYGFKFIDIPPFIDSQRIDLNPILTNPRLIDNPSKEEADHIRRIVKDLLQHIQHEKGAKCSPVLIHCADKTQGHKIYQALKAELDLHPKKYKKQSGVQEYYSSEQATPDARNQEEREAKERAGKNGMITISTVFDRGTDIKPTHAKGLYTVQTSVDTEPYSAEDLERAKRQKIGRAGRAGNVGYTRLIVRRSEFAPIYDRRQCAHIHQSVEQLDEAIRDLNRHRNEARTVDRAVRESFDDIKEGLFQQFFPFIQAVNGVDSKVPKTEIRAQLMTAWNGVLSDMDEYWENLQHQPHFEKASIQSDLEQIAKFAAEKWQGLGAELTARLDAWSSYHGLTLALPEVQAMDVHQMLTRIEHPYAPRLAHYVKEKAIFGKVNPLVSVDAVYCDEMQKDQAAAPANLSELRSDDLNSYLEQHRHYLTSAAHGGQLGQRFNLQAKDAYPDIKVKNIMGALLYLRYKAYREGNSLGYAVLKTRCKALSDKVIWSQNPDLILAMTRAQESHFNALTNHQGQHEMQKGEYLSQLMGEWQRQLPKETNEWKKVGFLYWMNGASDIPGGMKKQMVDWLTTYQNKWWKRSWVSADRKSVAKTFLDEIQAMPHDASPNDVLNLISKARTKLLQDDLRLGRSASDSLNGRLYQYLDEIESRVVAASDGNSLDQDLPRQFNDMAFTIECFKLRLQRAYPEISGKLGLLSAALGDPSMSVEKKYAMSDRFLRLISTMALYHKRFESEDLHRLQLYCREKQSRWVPLFEQCQDASQMNKKRSMQVYQAVSEAASGVMHDLRTKRFVSEPINLASKPLRIDYNGSQIVIVDKRNVQRPLNDKNTRFLGQLTSTKNYIDLLKAIEKAIVNKLPGETVIQFKNITISDSHKKQNQQYAYDLNIQMTIDGVLTSIQYQMNTLEETIICDIDSLLKLDQTSNEVTIKTFNLDKKVEDLKEDVDQHIEHAREVTEEADNLLENIRNLFDEEQNPQNDKDTDNTPRF